MGRSAGVELYPVEPSAFEALKRSEDVIIAECKGVCEKREIVRAGRCLNFI